MTFSTPLNNEVKPIKKPKVLFLMIPFMGLVLATFLVRRKKSGTRVLTHDDPVVIDAEVLPPENDGLTEAQRQKEILRKKMSELGKASAKKRAEKKAKKK